MELRSRKNPPASSVDYKEQGESHDADDIEAIIDISDSGEEYGVPSSDSDDSSYRDESELFEEHTVMGSTSKANEKPATSKANDNDLGPNDYDYVSLSDDDAGPSSKRMKMDPWMSDYNESFQPANVEQQVEQNLNAAPRKTKNKKSRKKRGKGNSGSLLLWEVWEEENNIWIDQNLSVDCDLENQQGFSEEIAEPPSELIMPLLRYQKEWLAWALKQEDSVVKGGILADEMGMGKTIQAIALVLAKREIDAVTCVFSEPFTSEGSPTALAGIKTTLVVCPVVAVSQWVSEINRFTREGSTKVLVYHGPDRDRFSKQFAEYDFVITTYSIVEYEFRKFMMPPKTKCEYCGKLLNDDKLSVHLKYFCGPYATRTLKQSKQEKKKSKVKLVAPKEKKKVSRRKAKQQNLEDDMDENEDLQPENSSQEKKSNLHSVKWGRIILDEAHFIKDRRSNTAKAIFALESSYKWALSGTPLQNRVGELYSLVRFLQIVPYSYYLCKDCDCRTLDFRSSTKCSDCNHSSVRHFCWWNRYISNPIQAYGNGDTGRRAMILLKHKVLKNIVLRRTKKGRAADLALPPRVVTLRKDTLDVKEEDYYESLYNESQAQFNTYVDAGTVMNNYAHIFDLLTRLRQAVDHPYLVVHSQTAALRSRDAKGDNNVEHECGICHDPAEDPVVTSCAHAFCKACLLDFSASLGKVSCPTCSKMLTVDLTSSATGDQPARTTIKGFRSSSILNRIQLNDFQTSTKIEALREEIRLMVERDGSAKGIVFSQFTSFLDLINYSLQKSGVNCVQLVGSMTLPKRDAAIKKFTDDPDCKIFLMSLKAGGVALNLTVASHVFLMDPWWNPAVERQAQDRIHRLGQYKPIRIVRFVIENTVEERILQLQEKKELVFEGTVGGSTEALGKLTEADLRFLFIT